MNIYYHTYRVFMFTGERQQGHSRRASNRGAAHSAHRHQRAGADAQHRTLQDSQISTRFGKNTRFSYLRYQIGPGG